MKRSFFKIMLLLGFVWVAYANAKLLDKLVDRFKNADQDIKTKLEMFQVARCVEMYCLDHNRLPAAADLPGLIRESIKDEERKQVKDPAKDMWGNNYWLVPAKAGFYIISAGPDKKWKSKDDLSFYQTLNNVGFSNPTAGPAPAVKTPVARKPGADAYSNRPKAQSYSLPRQAYSQPASPLPTAGRTGGGTAAYPQASPLRTMPRPPALPASSRLQPQPFQSRAGTAAAPAGTAGRQ